ncbi:MAG: PorT family protein [Tannerellaceae bacterium]|nr:PorT family protein [Tannerellaceae bacterium]
MKRIYWIGLFAVLGLFTHAQEPVKVEDKIFNWGAKLGLNSTFPIINSISIDDKKAENIRLQYRVGFLVATFCRINFDAFFIQPSISWHRSSGDIHFNLPVDPVKTGTLAATRNFDQLNYTVNSVEVPMLIGYKIVNESPYGLSFMAGPNIKYSYNIKYESDFYDSPRKYISDSTPWGINIVCGVGVSIWRFFFDVTYEFGLNQVDSDFKDNSSKEPSENNITIDKRTNVMSFSLGFLF